MNLSHVCLIVKDMKSMVDFYRRVLATEAELHGDDYAEFPSPGAILSLYAATPTSGWRQGRPDRAPTGA